MINLDKLLGNLFYSPEFLNEVYLSWEVWVYLKKKKVCVFYYQQIWKNTILVV